MRDETRRRIRSAVPPVAVFGLVLAFWYWLAYALDNNFASADGSALIVPPPHMLFDGVNATVRSDIVSAMRVSTSTALVGFGLAVVVGILLALAMSTSTLVESAVWPWLIAVQVTPVIVLTPIIVRVVGPSFPARVVITVLIAFFPITSNTLFGLKSVPQALHDLFTLSESGKVRRLVQLQLPHASPSVFAGLRTAAGLAVIGSIVGDFFFTRGTPGLGRLITFFFQETKAGPMFVTALVASLIGLGFFMAVGALRRLLVSPWDKH